MGTFEKGTSALCDDAVLASLPGLLSSSADSNGVLLTCLPGLLHKLPGLLKPPTLRGLLINSTIVGARGELAPGLPVTKGPSGVVLGLVKACIGWALSAVSTVAMGGVVLK